MGTYSKFFGSMIGGAAGFLVSVGLMPSEWASPEIIGALTTLCASLATYIAPANA